MPRLYIPCTPISRPKALISSNSSPTKSLKLSQYVLSAGIHRAYWVEFNRTARNYIIQSMKHNSHNNKHTSQLSSNLVIKESP